MKLRKIFIGLLVLSSMLLMVACNDTTTEQPHEHTYETEWNKDLTNHWHDAACGHDEIKDKAAHTWGEAVVTLEPTEEANGLKTYTCTVCGQTKEDLIDVLPHTHKYSSEWDKDATHHWHNPTCDDTEELKDKAEHTWNEGEVTKVATCAEKGEMTYTCTVCEGTKVEELPKATEHIEGEETEVVYVAGYAVTQYVTCKTEVSREACFTYSHTYRDAELEQTVTEILPVELVEGVYSFEFTTPQWGRIVMNLGDLTVSSADSVMLNSDGWAGGGYLGTYPLYHDGDTVTFLSATGGTYPVSYNPETKELLIGNYIEPLPENVFVVNNVNADSELAVWTTAGFELKTKEGAYATANGWRTFIVVDSEGKIAYMGKSMVNGYGGAMSTTYIRHSAYANYLDNPAFIQLGEPYENQWGMTCDWSLGVPEGGFVVTAHSNAQAALIEYLLGLAADNQGDATVNTNAHNVDEWRIEYDAENKWVVINEEVSDLEPEQPESNGIVIGEFTDKKGEAGNLELSKEGDVYVFHFDDAPTGKSRVYATVEGHDLATYPYLKVTYSCTKAFNLSVYGNGTSDSILYYENITDYEGYMILDLSECEDVVNAGAMLELVLMVDRDSKCDATTYDDGLGKTVYLSFEFVASNE